ncbi:MAG: formate dehydrogenase accessory sulfurtransferase FdhD [Thermincola sp.]|jgi:FdhD protein|nr:formate dehydrogenase accessory sulfurtransferase FdhD [Thermincola sp.]
MDLRHQTVQTLRIKDGESKPIEDLVTRESPLTIYLNDEEIVTLLCTMEYPDELAVGFLHSEGFLKSIDDIIEIKSNAEVGTVHVKSNRAATIAKETFLKRYITTGCGKGSTFYHLSDAVSKPISGGFRIQAEEIFNLMTQAQRQSELFKETGGVHSSAICSRDKILFFREDVGRHNTVDKLAGRCLLEKIPLDDKILITTGRISSEILIKTAKIGLPLLASRSAPTDLAIRHAHEMGITIAAFVRNQRMNVYAYPERVLF